MFGNNASGKPCRCCRYAGLLYESHTFPCASSQTRIFSGRSMATLGAASISGVPAFGLPKITSLVGGSFIPTFAASPLCSTSANSVTPLARRRAWSFSTVWSTECWLGRVIIPLSLCGVIVSPAFPGGPITTNAAPSAAKATMGRVELEVISITSFSRFVTYESPQRSISKDLTDVETLRLDVQHRSVGLFGGAGSHREEYSTRMSAAAQFCSAFRTPPCRRRQQL